MFCKILGLEAGTDLFVSPYPDVKVLDELYIDTDSPEDQEILVRIIINNHILQSSPKNLAPYFLKFSYYSKYSLFSCW